MHDGIKRYLKIIVQRIIKGYLKIIVQGIIDERAKGTFTKALEEKTVLVIQALISEIKRREQEAEDTARREQEAADVEIPAGADLLWILSGEDPQKFAQYAATFPDPALNELAQDPRRLNLVVEKLSRTITSGIEGASDGVPMAAMASSNIYGFRYDPRTGKLLVKFQGDVGKSNGSVYEYDKVPPNVYKIFRDGAIPAKTQGHNRFGRWWRGKKPSLGAAFYEMIKLGGYDYKQIA